MFHKLKLSGVLNTENPPATTIESVREGYKLLYKKSNIYTKIALKAWLNHSESRHRNNNPPYTFENYDRHMNYYFYIEQIELGMINCDDIGGKEFAINYLNENR